MIWQNAWAWAGIIALGVPIVIHLLGRGRARVHSFPTLRFIAPSRLLPTRRTRLHDLPLLLVRLGILLAAIAALAQPLLITASRARALDKAVARAIIVDTSASMGRETLNGERALDAARREATRLAAEAQPTTIVETNSPARAIAGVAGWLATQTGRTELAVLSDFQLGILDSANLAALPAAAGVRLTRIAVRTPTAPAETHTRFGDVDVVARIDASTEQTDVQWSAGRVSAASAAANRGEPTLLAGDAERDGVDAAARAARAAGVALPLDTAHAVAIVYPRYAQRAALLRGAHALRLPWMTAYVARLRADSTLAVAAEDATVVSAADSAAGLVVVRTRMGRAAVVAAQDSADGRERLLLFSLIDGGTLTSAALIASATRAASLAPARTELEPRVIDDSTIARWQRAPAINAATRNGARGGSSDGRWFWVLALLLLAIESWMRRARPVDVTMTRADDIAA
jgi:hypothetical protein